MGRAAGADVGERKEPDAGEGALDFGLLEEGVGPRARLLRNLLTSKVLAAMAPFGLRSGAHSTLALISANPGCSQNELARELAMDKSAMVAIVDELEAKGLAGRTRRADDRRRHALTLTPEGEAMLRQMHAAALAVERPIREALTASELAELRALLDRAYRALAGSGEGA